MSYHIFINLSELLSGDLAAKIGRGIFSKDLMDRECNCYLPSKVNRKCAYKGKCRHRCIIYEVKCSMCDDIYIGKTQKTLKKEWTVISPISYVYSRMDRNKTHFLPTPNITLTLLRHVQICVSIWR